MALMVPDALVYREECKVRSRFSSRLSFEKRPRICVFVALDGGGIVIAWELWLFAGGPWLASTGTDWN